MCVGRQGIEIGGSELAQSFRFLDYTRVISVFLTHVLFFECQYTKQNASNNTFIQKNVICLLSRFSRSSPMSWNAGNWLSVSCQPQVKVLIEIKVIWLWWFLPSIHPSCLPLCELTFASRHRPPMFLSLSSFTSITAHLQGVTTINFHFRGRVGMSCPCWLSI